MSHIFVSYSRKDSQIVDDITARLTGDGLNVWLDRAAIKGGELWREAIVEAIDNAYACVLMLSPNAAASDNVRREVDLAEGSNKELVPVMLAAVKVPSKLRYQLAGIQWIEYYRDPEAKYAELFGVLHDRQPKDIASETQTSRDVEIVIIGLDPSKLGPAEQEKLLNALAEVTDTPRTSIKVTTIRKGSVHVFVNMPTDAAYRLKAAALNRDLRLLNSGIHALRLTGDRHFVLLKTGRIGPLRGRFSGGSAIMMSLLISAILIYVVLSLITPPETLPFPGLPFYLFPTATPVPSSTPVPTKTLRPTPSYTPTPRMTLTPTPTRKPTITRTSTRTPTSMPSIPIFTFITGSFCRTGPGTAYPETTGIQAGDTVEIVGRNADNTWYYIFWKKFSVKCWVSSSTGQASGDVTGVPVQSVQAAPAPNSPPPPPTIHFSPSYQDVTTDFYVPCPGYYVELNWNEPADPSGIDLYQVQLDMDWGAGWVTVIDQYVSYPETSLEITDVISAHCPANLRALIRARDREGAWSDWDSLFWQSHAP